MTALAKNSDIGLGVVLSAAPEGPHPSIHCMLVDEAQCAPWPLCIRRVSQCG